jgi:hypothetical protein
MCTYSHEFTKCKACSDILYEDSSCTKQCDSMKTKGVCSGKTTDEKPNKLVEPTDCASCIKKEEEKKKRKAKEGCKCLDILDGGRKGIDVN